MAPSACNEEAQQSRSDEAARSQCKTAPEWMASMMARVYLIEWAALAALAAHLRVRTVACAPVCVCV
jgi:hypothetical protein